MTRRSSSVILLAGLLLGSLSGLAATAARADGNGGAGGASSPGGGGPGGVGGLSPYPSTWLRDLEQVPAFNLLTSPPQAEAKLEGMAGSILGVTPLAIPGNLRGTYRLSVSKSGYAHHAGQLDFRRAAPDHGIGMPTPASVSPVLALATPPGYLEAKQGMAWRGASTICGEAVAILGAAWAHRRASATASQAENLRQQAAAANGTTQAELSNQSARYAARADAWARGRSQWLIVGGGVWAASVLERTVLSGSDAPAVDGAGNLAISLRPLTVSAVAIRSAILPGWGQAYAGRGQAAGGFATAGLTLLAGLVLADQATTRAGGELAYAEREYDLARTLGEAETAEAQAALNHAADVADGAWSMRSLVLGSTAALWAYNIFDAAYFARGPGGDPGQTGARPAVAPLSPLAGRLGVEVRF